MHALIRNSCLIPAGLLLVVAMMSVAGCATGNTERAVVPGEDQWFIQQAHAYLSTEMGVRSPVKGFRVEGLERDNLGKVHLRMVQLADGVPVWGHTLRLHMDESGTVYRVDGEVLKGLTLFQLPPLVGVEEALHRGLSAKEYKNHGLFLYVDNMERGVIPVYEIEVMEGLRRQFFLLDARSGAVVKRVEGSPSR